MCVNALTKINKTSSNLSFFESQVLLEKTGKSLGISSIKEVTQKLRPGYYKAHPTFLSSCSQKASYFPVVTADAGANYDSYIIFYVNVFAFFDLARVFLGGQLDHTHLG